MTAEDFKAWRTRLRLSQQQAATLLGLTKRTVQVHENGLSPTIPRTTRLACAALQHGIMDFVPVRVAGPAPNHAAAASAPPPSP